MVFVLKKCLMISIHLALQNWCYDNENISLTARASGKRDLEKSELNRTGRERERVCCVCTHY